MLESPATDLGFTGFDSKLVRLSLFSDRSSLPCWIVWQAEWLLIVFSSSIGFLMLLLSSSFCSSSERPSLDRSECYSLVSRYSFLKVFFIVTENFFSAWLMVKGPEVFFCFSVATVLLDWFSTSWFGEFSAIISLCRLSRYDSSSFSTSAMQIWRSEPKVWSDFGMYGSLGYAFGGGGRFLLIGYKELAKAGSFFFCWS